MAESIVRLSVEDSSFNAHIKRAAKEFADFGKRVAEAGSDAFGKFAKGTETAKVAFQGFNKALKANVFVLVASLAVEAGQAIGEIIGNWISGANDAEDAQRKLNEELEKTAQAIQDINSVSDFNARIAKAAGKSTSEILKMKYEAADLAYNTAMASLLNPAIKVGTEEYDKAKKMLDEAEKRRRKALEDIQVDETARQYHTGEYAQKGGGRVSSKSGKTITYASNSITAQAALVAELNKKWNDAGEDMRTGYLFQLIEAEKKLKDMKGEQQAIRDMMTWGELKGVSPIGLGYSLVSPDVLKKFKPKLNVPDKKVVKLDDSVEKIMNGVNSITGGIESLGIELPDELKSVVNGISGVISILSGISTILVAIEAIAGADAIIPFARGGIVHAAGGYVVPGGHFSGDMVPAYLNSGELVLNRAQQASLANQLSEGSPFRNMVLTATLSGEDLRLAINRNGRRTGRGEIVTTNFK